MSALAKHRIAPLAGGTMAVVMCLACGATMRTVDTDRGATAPSSFPEPRGRTDIVAASEIARLGTAVNALDAVRLLRPEFLQSRGVSSRGEHLPPTVYLDNVRLGSLQALETIPVGAIHEIRYLTPFTASLWLTPESLGGAILVRTRPR